MARLFLSRDVNETLLSVEHISGLTGKVLIDLACEYATPYLAGYNESVAVPQSQVVRRSMSSQAELLLVEWAQVTGTTKGQVADYLLRQYLPVVVYDRNMRSKVLPERVNMQVHPMVLTRFHEVKAEDEIGCHMKVQDYLWSLTRELPDNVLAGIIDEAAATIRSYIGVPYTSMTVPHRVYTLVAAAANVYHLPKAGLFSAFIIGLLRWYKRLDGYSLLTFPESGLEGRPYNADALAELLRYSFDLGLHTEDKAGER